MLQDGKRSKFSTQVVVPYSETFSDNWPWSPFMEKAKPFMYMMVIILQHWPWGQEAWGILGRSSELASPPNGHQLLSEYPKPSREAQARPTALVPLPKVQETSCQAGHRLPAPTTGGIYKPSRAWRLVRDFKDKPAAFPESSRVIKLACPDEKPGKSGLQIHRLASGCLHVFTTRVWLQKWEQHACWFQPVWKTYLPEGDMNEEYFKNRFQSAKFPQSQEAESIANSLYLPLAVGLGNFIWTRHYSDFLSD